VPGSLANDGGAEAASAPMEERPEALDHHSDAPAASDGRVAESGELSGQEPPVTSADPADSGADSDELAALADAVQQHLDRDEIAPALRALSDWYRSPGAAEEHKVQLHPLMDQLAGTVIYSRRHLLQPAYIVREEDTLEEIAQRHQVPTVLLAKINGIVPPYELFPGERLKVVEGPFRAETSVARREMTLYLGPLYAGRFPVRLGREFPGQEAVMEVVEKLEQRAYTDPTTHEETAAGHPDNPYGRCWIGLREPGETAGSPGLGIHGRGDQCGPDDARGCIGLSPRDAEDLHSILSIGSTVRITR
jgi:LysM repeat protein